MANIAPVGDTVSSTIAPEPSTYPDVPLPAAVVTL